MTCKSYGLIGTWCVFRCSSVITGEGTVVRNCREIGRMRVIYKVGIIDYWLSGYCRGGRDSGGGRRGRRRLGEGRR
jgi:hypothetical protein